MKRNRWIAAVAAVGIVAMLGGCAEDGAAVYVQSVQELSGMSAVSAGDKFPGMVVSENVTEIKRDSDKAIAELLVKEEYL